MTSSIVHDHQATIVNGQYVDEIGDTEINAFCNDKDGFSIYAVGYSADEYGNTYLLDSASRTDYNIPTGTASSGQISNWAMKITLNDTNKTEGSIENGFESYSNIPSSYTQVAKRQNATGTESTLNGVKFNTSYATYISSTQIAGSYQGKVKYTLVHPHNEIPAQSHDTEAGHIAYYPNTNIYEGSMGQQEISDTDTAATLLASNFKRDGYGFAGWNTAYDYSGDYYGPNETINFTPGQYSGANKGLSLYAVWIKTSGPIQDWAGCDSLIATSYDAGTGELSTSPASIIALTDLRDSQTYAVARLANGSCWMIENLRLDAESTRKKEAPSLSQGFSQSVQYGDFIGLADAENTNFSDSTQRNSIYGIGSESTIDIGSSNYPGFRIPRYNDSNTSHATTNPNNGDSSIYNYGNYYTWAASLANTKYYQSGYIPGSQEEHNSNTANTSICPSGWRLPYGSDNVVDYYGDFANLDIAMGGNGMTDSKNAITGDSMALYWRRFPNNLVLSGDAAGASISNRGNYGYYWSTTAYEYDKAYGLSIGMSYVNSGIDAYNKYLGFSVRCIVEN